MAVRVLSAPAILRSPTPLGGSSSRKVDFARLEDTASAVLKEMDQATPQALNPEKIKIAAEKLEGFAIETLNMTIEKQTVMINKQRETIQSLQSSQPLKQDLDDATREINYLNIQIRNLFDELKELNAKLEETDGSLKDAQKTILDLKKQLVAKQRLHQNNAGKLLIQKLDLETTITEMANQIQQLTLENRNLRLQLTQKNPDDDLPA